MARRRATRPSRLHRSRLRQSAWQQVCNRLPPIGVLSADEVEHIHAGSLRILRDIGMTKDTLERYENAFYEPMLSDWRTFEAWTEDGARSATERANGIWKQLLEDYQRPAMDPAIEEELTDYVARRKIAIVRDGQ